MYLKGRIPKKVIVNCANPIDARVVLPDPQSSQTYHARLFVSVK